MITSDNFETFWETHITKEQKILFILGHGFDPRMCLGLKKISEIFAGQIDLHVIKYGDKTKTELITEMFEKNNQELLSLISSKIRLEELSLKTTSKNKTTAEARKITEMFSDIADFEKYSDVILDISALPTRLYFPLCGKILHILDHANNREKIPNFHVVVSENQLIDSKIQEIEVENRANYLYSFTADLGKEADTKPNVWIPLLGENTDIHLAKIQTLIDPVEICPLFPSPSVNPRRGDDLILEYVDLFSKFQVETRNFVYGAEQNPFEAYRQIMETIHRYPAVFVSQGGCRIALSALTSKLLSLSAFLVATEMKNNKNLSVGIAHISAKTYEIDPTIQNEKLINKSKLFSVWMAGTCYE